MSAHPSQKLRLLAAISQSLAPRAITMSVRLINGGNNSGSTPNFIHVSVILSRFELAFLNTHFGRPNARRKKFDSHRVIRSIIFESTLRRLGPAMALVALMPIVSRTQGKRLASVHDLSFGSALSVSSMLISRYRKKFCMRDLRLSPGANDSLQNPC